MQMQNPIPVAKWEEAGNVWPTKNSWHNMLRPENLRDELLKAGVVAFVAGRWIIFPDKWREYAAANHRPRAA